MEACVSFAAAWCRARLRRGLKQVLLAGSVTLLVACGGGGGSDPAGSGSAAPVATPASAPASAPAETLAIAYDRSTVEANWAEGTAPGALVLQATGTGVTQRALFIGAATADGKSDSNIERVDVSVSGTSATVTIVPAAGLAVGRHDGTLTLRACYDSDCTEQVGGSPTTIRYAFTVSASPLRTDPAALGLVAFAGETVTGNFKVIGASAGQVLNVTPRDAWLRTAVSSGSGNPTVTVEATAGSVGAQTTVIDIENNGLKYALPVTLNSVPKHLSLSTKSLAMTASAGSADGARCEARVGVRPGSGASGFTVTTASTWFKVVAQDANGFTVQTDLLPPRAAFSSSAVVRSGTEVEVLPLRCSIVSTSTSPVTGLSVAQQRITLWAPEGGSSAAQALGLTRPSWNPEVQSSVTYAQGTDWLRMTPTAAGDLQVAANAAGLASGVYDATVNVTAGFPAVPAVVRVRLTVGNALASPVPQTVTIGSSTKPEDLSGTIRLIGRGDLVRWTASTRTPWLRIDSASGDMDTPLAFSVDTAQALLQAPYIDIAGTITIQAVTAAGSPVTPVDAQLVLRRDLAEINGVGPGTIIAGKSTEVVVRGRGFSRLSNPIDRVRVNSVKPLSGSVVSDTAMRLVLPALGAGDATLSVSNAFGIDTGRATLHVVAAGAAPAAALPTGGSPWSIVHDPQRRQVFVANPVLGTVQRWREQAGGWMADKLDVADLSDIALSVDGGTLFVTRSPGQVLLVDPVPFTVRSTHDAPARFYPLPKLGTGLAATNDGKLWLTTIDSKPIVFDLATRTFADARFDGVETAFNGGPWFVAARNGDRIVAVPSTSGAPMLAMNASTGQWRANPIDLSYFYWPLNGLGDTGRRLLVMGGVWASDYSAIGRQLLPPGWLDGAAVLSPDGDRLHVFALPPTWNLAGSTEMPKIFVFDTSQSVGTNVPLPLLTTIAVPEYPTCRVDSAVPGTCVRPVMTVSADGATLFVAGESKLVVLPLTDALQTLSVALDRQSLFVEQPTQASTSVTVNATVSPLPSGSVYPRVVSDQPVFVGGLVDAQRNADGSYGVPLTVKPGLAPGTYTGALTLQLCREPSCESRYLLTGNTLLYTVTVLWPLSLSMTINGANQPVPGLTSQESTSVRPGDTIVVTGVEPMVWESQVGVVRDFVTLGTSWSKTVAPQTPAGTTIVLKAQSAVHPSNTRQLSFVVAP